MDALYIPQTREVRVIEKLHPAPSRKRGTVATYDADSFIESVQRQCTPGTTLHGAPCVDSPFFCAVFNGHMPVLVAPVTAPAVAITPAGWGDHRALLKFKHTDEWRCWQLHDGGHLGQLEFAEFLEDMSDSVFVPESPETKKGESVVRYPNSRELLETALALQATKNVEFRSSQRLRVCKKIT